MISSFINLLNAPYNRNHLFYAFYRFLLWKFIRVFKINKYSLNIWNNKRVILNYKSIQYMYLMYYYWVDWEEYNFIKDILKHNDIVFDVGANVGLYTLWISNYTLPECIHSFEPDSKNYYYLDANIKLNNLENFIHLNKLGIAEKCGTLFLTQGDDVKNHLSFEDNPGVEKIEVISIDEYCIINSINKIKYLKLDIEGFELSALKGADKLLSNGLIDIIQLEINSALVHSGVSVFEVLEYLGSKGYELCIFSVLKRQIVKVTFSENRENYLAIKNIKNINMELKSLYNN